MDRHHFSQNLIQSWGLIFLVKSSKPKPLISRKKYSASGKRCFTLSKKAPGNKPTNPTPKTNKKPKQKTQASPRKTTHNRLQSLELFLSDYHEGKSFMKVFNCLLFSKAQNDRSCLMMSVERTSSTQIALTNLKCIRSSNDLSNFTQTG